MAERNRKEKNERKTVGQVPNLTHKGEKISTIAIASMESNIALKILENISR